MFAPMSSPLSKERAIRMFGSQAKLAIALGISRAAVAQWGDTVPEKQALRIRYELQPRRNGKRK